MRLIDADNLNFEGQKYNKSQMKSILDFIDKQPTTYDADKVVKRLRKELKLANKEKLLILDCSCIHLTSSATHLLSLINC